MGSREESDVEGLKSLMMRRNGNSSGIGTYCIPKEISPRASLSFSRLRARSCR